MGAPQISNPSDIGATSCHNDERQNNLPHRSMAERERRGAGHPRKVLKLLEVKQAFLILFYFF